MSYLIFSDVSLDIDKNFADSHDVRYVPMEYVLGDETFHCDKPESDSMMHNYYEKLRQKVKTQTSQITPTHYMDLFEPLIKEGNDIVYLRFQADSAIHMNQHVLRPEILKKIIRMPLLR